MNPDELSAIAGADQQRAGVVNIAADLAAYRSRLIADKIPRALADELTLQAAAFMWRGSGCACEGE